MTNIRNHFLILLVMTFNYFINPTVWPNFENDREAMELLRDKITASTTPAGVGSKGLVPYFLQKEATEVLPSLGSRNLPPPKDASITRRVYPAPYLAGRATRPTLLGLLRDPPFEKLFKNYQTLRLLMPAGNFGALQLDNENQKWIRSHVVEADGSLESRNPIWEYMSNASPVAPEPCEGMKTAASFGLCAGKLYIPSHLVKGCTPAADFQCSGVTLERRFFMTVHQFDPNGPDSLHALMKPDGIAVSISIARSSKSSEEDLTVRRAFLRFFNKESDFALFQLDEGFEDFPNSVRSSHLIRTDQLDFNQNFAGKRVWSVGFACGEDERYTKYWDLLRHVASHDNSLIIEAVEKVTPPNFDAIFHPNQRALRLGKIVSKRISSHRWYHSIPGWFGISGSLIGYFTRDERGELIPVIIGMFASGDTAEEFNQLVPLTSDLLQQVGAIVEAEKD